jgi:hypothetical protein
VGGGGTDEGEEDEGGGDVGGEHEGVEVAGGVGEEGACSKLGDLTHLVSRVSFPSNWGISAGFLLAKTILVLLDLSIS